VNRKVFYFVTASLDGFIARDEGSIDWLIQAEGDEDFGFSKFQESIDTVVQGRQTYEQVLTFGAYPYADHKNYVFSRKLLSVEHAEVIRHSVPEFMHRMQSEPGKHIWLVGGGNLATSFFEANAIDELIVFVQPILLGRGIPLASQLPTDVRLKLEHSHAFEQGLVELRYQVIK